jgi:segregation and condensation protein B
MNEADLVAAAECVLYLAGEPVSAAELARILEVPPPQADRIAAQFAASLNGRGLQVIKVAGGYRLCTRPQYSRYVERIHPPKRLRLSRAALETLAIVAYRQPATRPEIEAIRGVNVDGVVETLLTYGLVFEKGKKQAPGRPTLYVTTEEFLVRFGLNRLSDLPPLPEGEQKNAYLLQPALSDQDPA